jgi:hypothetical protein
MKNLILVFSIVIFITQTSCDSEDNNDLIQKVDCNELLSGLLAYDNEKIKKEFDKITSEFNPTPDTDDQIGHKDNFQELNTQLSKCDLISSELLCYACIETYPAQTEILISIDSSGRTVKRIVDVLTPDDNSLSFHRVHEYHAQGISLQKTYYFGCFESNPINSSMKSINSDSDTLYYTIDNDTLTLNAIFNYNCGGLLKDSVAFDSEKVNIYVSDTCQANCEVRCMCDFGFEYKFTDFWQKNTHFYVYLNGYHDNEYKLWKDTKFIDGLD